VVVEILDASFLVHRGAAKTQSRPNNK
jgi:hypothetical protein